MPATDNIQRHPLTDLGTHIPLARGNLGERTKHIQPRECRRHTLETPNLRPRHSAQRLEQLPLEGLNTLGSVQYLLLELLERRRDIPLRAGQRLTTLIIRRNQMRVRVRDLNEIAEHAIVADLERCNSCALTLRRLHRGNGILPTGCNRAQFVQVGVDASGDSLAFANTRPGTLDQHPLNLCREINAGVPRGNDLRERSSWLRTLQGTLNVR